jgi:ABC-2 type transport system permease protein
MNILPLIIKREFIAKVRNKSFIVMTFLSPLLLVTIAGIIAYFTSIKADVKTIGIHDETGIFVSEFKNSPEFNYQDLSKVNMDILKNGLVKEQYEGIIFIPKVAENGQLKSNISYISNNSPSLQFLNETENVIAQKITKINFEKENLDAIKIKKATAVIDIKVKNADGENTIKGLSELKFGIGCAFGYLIMMFIIIYGNMVMRSIIEEKTNRIIEIIISSVKPFQIMMGKIIGTSLAGILQFLIWCVVGLGLMTIASQNIITPEIKLYLNELWKLPIASILGCYVLYFIGGFYLYSSFYAAIGAAVDSETDTQQFLMPIVMLLMLGFYIGFGTVMNNPNGMVATLFSMIPLTSPIVMMMRIPFGVPWWQIAISITILYATFFGVVWFAAKIYRIGILMYGKKPTWKELFKWLKY